MALIVEREDRTRSCWARGRSGVTEKARAQEEERHPSSPYVTGPHRGRAVWKARLPPTALGLRGCRPVIQHGRQGSGRDGMLLPAE